MGYVMEPNYPDLGVRSSGRTVSELSIALDESYTVAALLVGALKTAEHGSSEERCLRVASEALMGVIKDIARLA